MKVFQFKTIAELSKWAADFVCTTAKESIEKRGFFTICLSGGASPALLYYLLSTYEYSSRIEWGKTYIFWSDERFVDHEDDNSNYKVAYDNLLSKASIRQSHIFPIIVEGKVEEAAAEYERQIREFFKEKTHSSPESVPEFDLVLLGMGGDGHTASLFPGSPELTESKKLVVSVKAPDYAPVQDRISFSFKLINNASNILLMVTGNEKLKLIKMLISGDTSINIPAQMIRNTDKTYLLTEMKM